MPEILLLDAMGVLYQSGDDVADLLVPFVRKHGRADLASDAIERLYTSASLGELVAAEFWAQLGVDPALEDTYLAGHRLVDGIAEALPLLEQRFGGLACLSNDVADWSIKLRRHFGLERWIARWFISGDMGLRKPSPAIYSQTIERLGVEPQDITFVDDRPRNLDAARRLGIRTVLLDVEGRPSGAEHRAIRRLAELL